MTPFLLYLLFEYIIMRAKTVRNEAVIFDFDDTLVKDSARSHLYRDGKYIRSMDADEFNHYIKQPNEEFDFSEFDNAKFIKAKKGPAWYLLHIYNDAAEEARSYVPIFIITARRETVKPAIIEFLRRNEINNLPAENIYCVGSPDVRAEDIPQLKENIILTEIKPYYSKITIYDDNDLTINHLKTIPGINAVLIK